MGNVLSNDILTISFCLRTELQYKQEANDALAVAAPATIPFVETKIFVSFDLSMDIFSVNHPATITKGHTFSTVYTNVNKDVTMCICDKNMYTCLSKDKSRISKGSYFYICVMGSSPSTLYDDVELNNIIFYQDDIPKFTPVKEGLRAQLSTTYKVKSPLSSSSNERNFRMQKKERYISVLKTQLPSSFYNNNNDNNNPTPVTILGEATLSKKDDFHDGQKKNHLTTTKLVTIVGIDEHNFLGTFVLDHYFLIAFISICFIASIILLNVSYKIVIKERLYNSVPVYVKNNYSKVKKRDSFNEGNENNNNSWHNGNIDPRQQLMVDNRRRYSSTRTWDEDHQQQQKQHSLRRRSFNADIELEKAAEIAAKEAAITNGYGRRSSMDNSQTSNGLLRRSSLGNL